MIRTTVDCSSDDIYKSEGLRRSEGAEGKKEADQFLGRRWAGRGVVAPTIYSIQYKDNSTDSNWWQSS